MTRELHQTVAQYFLTDSGEVILTHFEPAGPDRPFDAGFQLAFKRFSFPILDPVLTVVSPYLNETLPPDQVDALRELGRARRGRADEVSMLTATMLMPAVSYFRRRLQPMPNVSTI